MPRWLKQSLQRHEQMEIILFSHPSTWIAHEAGSESQVVKRALPGMGGEMRPIYDQQEGQRGRSLDLSPPACRSVAKARERPPVSVLSWIQRSNKALDL